MPNLLDRNFTPAAPTQVWTAELTCIWTDGGWLYLAIVLGLFNREVAGGSIKLRMSADIVVDAPTMAWFRRKPAPGVIHRSDRGSPYASEVFQAKLTEFGNAPKESFFNDLKNERVHGTRYATRAAAMADLFNCVEVFCDRSRRHSTLGYQSPSQFLLHWITSRQQRKLAA